MKKPRSRSAPKPPAPESRVALAVIGAPHGVRGECRVKAYTADPMAIADYGPLFSEDGRVFEIEQGRFLKDDMLVVKFVGEDDRDRVKALTGLLLYVDRASLPPPDEEDEFYHADLIGLPVYDQAGALVGTVLAMHDFGAGDLMEIRPASGGGTWLQPFTRVATPVVDIPGRRIVIDPAFLAKPERRPPGMGEEG
ncbi:ribosome maturation factor RimM [Rhabdaerophilum sp. SD176]|uniref:ribosome maturation factor RimM n=1 Tax=Rhabdaerophilum sp. SD176 TaxID=2983548 RepID=UPI0024DF91D2|nr:ribosome maturation factor RimM [Rhabdaerophilum sp. SD176]